MNDDKKTDFGYKVIPQEEKKQRVGNVFHSVATKYDIMNDLMSLGIHKLWKRMAIEISGIRQGHKVLDIAGGTGDMAKLISPLVGQTGSVTLADINDSMLMQGRDKLINKGCCNNIAFIQADAEKLPFADNSFDCCIIAFGLRNVTDKSAALKAILRVLKPHSRVVILEFSKPTNALFNKIYDLYSFNILPRLGKIVSNDAESYRYLVESIRMHPDQETLRSMMEEAGFTQCTYHNMTNGIVAAHVGIKP